MNDTLTRRLTSLKNMHVEAYLTIAAGLIVASLLDGVIGSVLNPMMTALKMAPYNGETTAAA